MNNGVNNTNTENTTTLAPMAGVKIAPAAEGPVNASGNNQLAAHVTQTPQPVAQTPATPEPMITKTVPVVQNATPTTNAPMLNPLGQVPKINQPTNTPPEPPQPVVPQQPVVAPAPKLRFSLTPILLLLLVGLGAFLFYTMKSDNQKLSQMKYNCTPIGTTNEEKELDVNSTIVQTLYSKVATNIREDLAQPNFNDEMKIYLAYRQILETDKYDSNCNGFDGSMNPYTCKQSTTWNPKAFKQELLQLKLKELFGENTNIPLRNIQLGNTCIVGYQYIEARGEFVEGQCGQKTATSFKVTKNITKAVSTRNMIILTEEVKYQETEGLTLPDYLKNGTYQYVFRLDMNYNYVLVSKTYESKY